MPPMHATSSAYGASEPPPVAGSWQRSASVVCWPVTRSVQVDNVVGEIELAGSVTVGNVDVEDVESGDVLGGEDEDGGWVVAGTVVPTRVVEVDAGIVVLDVDDGLDVVVVQSGESGGSCGLYSHGEVVVVDGGNVDVVEATVVDVVDVVVVVLVVVVWHGCSLPLNVVSYWVWLPLLRLASITTDHVCDAVCAHPKSSWKDASKSNTWTAPSIVTVTRLLNAGPAVDSYWVSCTWSPEQLS